MKDVIDLDGDDSNGPEPLPDVPWQPDPKEIVMCFIYTNSAIFQLLHPDEMGFCQPEGKAMWFDEEKHPKVYQMIEYIWRTGEGITANAPIKFMPDGRQLPYESFPFRAGAFTDDYMIDACCLSIKECSGNETVRIARSSINQHIVALALAQRRISGPRGDIGRLQQGIIQVMRSATEQIQGGTEAPAPVDKDLRWWEEKILACRNYTDTVMDGQEGRVLLFPCNVNNNHWVGGLIDFAKKELKYFDSLFDISYLLQYRAHVFVLIKLYGHVKQKKPREWLAGWKWVFQKTPQQTNGHSCGDYVVLFAQQVLAGRWDIKGRDVGTIPIPYALLAARGEVEDGTRPRFLSPKAEETEFAGQGAILKLVKTRLSGDTDTFFPATREEISRLRTTLIARILFAECLPRPLR